MAAKHITNRDEKYFMKKKWILYGSILIAVLFVIYIFFIKNGKQPEKFSFDTIKRENIFITISSTGTMEAITTVDIGTQISGKVKKLFVDFNSHVKKGQILAVIDTTPLALQVNNARAGLFKAQTQFEQAKVLFNNSDVLYEKGLLTKTDYISSKTTLESDSADVLSAKGSLEQAKTNLSYAYIYSPINGIIINKNVLEGQTVAASLQTPVLFSIAQDLSKMQILASVDESDIGQIKLGQKANFTVQAYPDKKFYGQVVQIRLNSQVVSNVVEYTVVVNADNLENILLPGMTATIDFIIQESDNVLAVPNAALKYMPAQQTLDGLKGTIQNKIQNLPDSIKAKLNSLRRNGSNQNKNASQTSQSGGNQSVNIAKIWYLDDNGKLNFSFALLGITDGMITEITWSGSLNKGMKVITGIQNNAAGTLNSNKPNPTNSTTRSLRRGF